MKNYVLLVVCLIFSSSEAPPPQVSKQYRTDYEYNRKTDAFYKLHIETTPHYLVEQLCKVEGAELMVPRSDYDIEQMHGMFKKFPDIGNYVWVGNDGKNHESAEEVPIIDLEEPPNFSERFGSCVVGTRNGDVETSVCYRGLPFICKVSAMDAPYDRHCNVYGRDYKYYPSTRSCYKIPSIAFPWSEAYSECQAEGAHLVVMNSEAEHLAIMNLTSAAPKVRGAKASYFFFAGFRAEKPVGNATVVFKTIFNETLSQAGYENWSDNEPNNSNGEYCGSIFLNDGKLNDLHCHDTFAFICEKEVSS
uniref:LL3 n=1 Tax=Spodoptera exigua TaxID=7107 RepID=A0A0H4T1R3_SPOEX|nr:LL3 [Spodoptera exigua]